MRWLPSSPGAVYESFPRALVAVSAETRRTQGGGYGARTVDVR
jgi:hypothetical protein